MITTAVIHFFASVFIWIAGLLPQFHLSEIGGFGAAVAEIWVQAATWSGVVPLQSISLIFQAVLLITINMSGASLIRFVMNIARGSGA